MGFLQYRDEFAGSELDNAPERILSMDMSKKRLPALLVKKEDNNDDDKDEPEQFLTKTDKTVVGDGNSSVVSSNNSNVDSPNYGERHYMAGEDEAGHRVREYERQRKKEDEFFLEVERLAKEWYLDLERKRDARLEKEARRVAAMKDALLEKETRRVAAMKPQEDRYVRTTGSFKSTDGMMKQMNMLIKNIKLKVEPIFVQQTPNLILLPLRLPKLCMQFP